MTVVEKSIEVQRPARTVYNQWTQFEEFPRFMEGVEAVRRIHAKRLPWVANIGGTRKEWEAVITEERPNERIAWRSVGDSQVDNAGAVRFDDRGGRTNIEVSLEYNPPGGKAGELVAELFKDPEKQVQRAVESFRMVVERGGLGAA